MGDTVSSRTSAYASVLVRSESRAVAPNSTVRMTEGQSDKTPSLWTSFAVAWLLVLAVVVWRLPGIELSPPRLGGSAACLALLALSYLWLTVRHAPGATDLTADTPGGRLEPAVVGALAAMTASVVIFT